MRYLVTGQYVEPGPLLPPDKVVEMVENVAIPSLQMLAKLESDGKIVAGGIHTAARTGTMIVEAASHQEVDEMVGQIPFWGLLHWTVTPLVAFSDRARFEAGLMAELKKRLAG